MLLILLAVSQAFAQVPWELLDCDSIPNRVDGRSVNKPDYCQPKQPPKVAKPKPPKPDPAPQPKPDLSRYKPNAPAPSSNPLNDYRYAGHRPQYSPSHPANDMSADLINQGASDLFSSRPERDYSHIYAKADAYKSATKDLKAKIDKLSKPTKTKVNLDDVLEQALKEEISKTPKAPPKAASKPKAVKKDPKPNHDYPDVHLASNGLFRKNIEDLLYKLNRVEPKYERQYNAKHLGLVSVQEADNSYVAGKTNDANYFAHLAEGFLDIAVGIDPITGTARSAYELITGKNLVTGVELSNLERSLAFVGAITFGAAPNVVKMTTAFNKVMKGASAILKNRQAVEAAVTKGATLAARAEHALGDWKKSHKITNIIEAAEANASHIASGRRPPFKHDTHVIEFVTTKETKWVRVHGDVNQAGPWMVKASAIKGLSPAQIQQKLALPDVPKYVSDVILPPGTKMMRGLVEFHDFTNKAMSGKSGAVQYVLDGFAKEAKFINKKAL